MSIVQRDIRTGEQTLSLATIAAGSACIYYLAATLQVQTVAAAVATKIFVATISSQFASSESCRSLKTLTVEILAANLFATMMAVAILSMAHIALTPLLVFTLASTIAAPSIADTLIRATYTYFTESYALPTGADISKAVGRDLSNKDCVAVLAELFKGHTLDRELLYILENEILSKASPYDVERLEKLLGTALGQVGFTTDAVLLFMERPNLRFHWAEAALVKRDFISPRDFGPFDSLTLRSLMMTAMLSSYSIAENILSWPIEHEEDRYDLARFYAEKNPSHVLRAIGYFDLTEEHGEQILRKVIDSIKIPAFIDELRGLDPHLILKLLKIASAFKLGKNSLINHSHWEEILSKHTDLGFTTPSLKEDLGRFILSSTEYPVAFLKYVDLLDLSNVTIKEFFNEYSATAINDQMLCREIVELPIHLRKRLVKLYCESACDRNDQTITNKIHNFQITDQDFLKEITRILLPKFNVFEMLQKLNFVDYTLIMEACHGALEKAKSTGDIRELLLALGLMRLEKSNEEKFLGNLLKKYQEFANETEADALKYALSAYEQTGSLIMLARGFGLNFNTLSEKYCMNKIKDYLAKHKKI